ncbi:lipopolysaccharide biosynthesis protein [Streptococcus alactolyticus]|uniref:Oligosaccharide flippase family protein n=1 Tax=Streptococcus alactolyticus TaxID=29389 RepID=A0A6N7X6Z4_STRAY|nr:oligosaccharide flippase family protein [Streptococcus alactolyticus]MST54369.1 oligosaccharide flippase family protein [Streptococcus alactolyticus]
MGRYKYLFKNIGLLTLSQFATKFLSFFLVPLYTSILTTAEYGTYDLFNTTIGVLLPVLTLNIQEAILRFSLDKKANKDAIVSVGFRYLAISNIIIALGLIANHFMGINDAVRNYSVLIFFMFFVQSLSGIITTYARGVEKISDLSISSVIASIVTISCNILFLVVFRWGLIGYFLANIIGPFSQSVFLFIRTGFLSHIKGNKYEEESKEMTSYSKPLIANSIAWWVNNSLDKYVIVFFCGLADNGIFSVAGKIPSILNIFQSIFNQAWTLSAVKDYDPDDKSGFFSNIYKAYNCMMVILCAGIILFDKVLAKLLYVNEFYAAWKYVPWLTIAIVFGALSGYLGGFFAAVKDSKVFSYSSVVGAITNLVLNVILTMAIGTMGAAIATTICYVEIWAIRFWQAKKYIKLSIRIQRDILSYILLVVQSIILVQEISIGYLLQTVVFASICGLYIKDIKSILIKILKKG